MSLTSFLLNRSKSYLLLVKARCQGKKGTPKCSSTKQADVFIKNETNLRESESDQLIKMKAASEGCKTVLMLYANDSEERASRLATRSASSSEHQSYAAIFQLKQINVETINSGEQLFPQRQSIDFGSQLPALVCILISGTMANLINSDTSAVRHLLAPYFSADSVDSYDYDGMPIVLAFYDEHNEINMYRIKYRLPACTYISICDTTTDLHQLIWERLIQACNERLYKRHHHTASALGKPLFKLFPKKLVEANAQVVLSLVETVPSGQLVDVLLNGRSTFGSLQLKWTNRGTLRFIVPDELLKNDSVRISVAINCASFLGTRAIKCERESPIDCRNLISTLNSSNYLCESMGTESIRQLDQKLAQVFDSSLPDLGIFSYITNGAIQSNTWLPTWLHFASAYDLKDLTLSLLKSPASARAFFVKNSAELTPIDVAIKQGHWEIVAILCEYAKQIEHIQQQLTHDVASSTFHDTCVINDEHCLPQNGQHQQHSEQTGKSSLVASDANEGHPMMCSSEANHRIIEAKNELLMLIEKFKCGISIGSFERMFFEWETTYKDVLEGQMSPELEYSLSQIRKLCTDEEGLDSADQSECETTSEVDSVHRFKQNDAPSVTVSNEARAGPNAIRSQTLHYGEQLNQGHGHASAPSCLLNHKHYRELLEQPQAVLSKGSPTHSKLLAATDTNRQFSCDLNSINMPDNEVCRKERTNWRMAMPTVPDCQAECHQFATLVPAAAYMPSALWGQLMQQQQLTKESIWAPECASISDCSNGTTQTQWPTGDNNAHTTCGAPLLTATTSSAHLAAKCLNLTNSAATHCGQWPQHSQLSDSLSPHSHGKHEYYEFSRTRSHTTVDKLQATSRAKDCLKTTVAEVSVSKQKGDMNRSSNALASSSSHYYLIPRSVAVPVRSIAGNLNNVTVSNKVSH